MPTPCRSLCMIVKMLLWMSFLFVPICGSGDGGCRAPPSSALPYIKLATLSLFQEVPVEDVAKFFPFTKYFENAPQPLFKCRTYREDMDIAEGCYRYIEQIFTQLTVGGAIHQHFGAISSEFICGCIVVSHIVIERGGRIGRARGSHAGDWDFRSQSS